MKRDCDQLAENVGLLANGAAGRWDISVDESHDGARFYLEIDGPQTYLTFQLHDLDVIPKFLHFLRLEAESNREKESLLDLGRFGTASVELRWDDEDFPRCFLVIAPQTHSAFFLTLQAEDIQMLGEALEQIVKDLPSGQSK